MTNVQDKIFGLFLAVLDRWNRSRHGCKQSPDRRHIIVVRQGKYECKYCGEPPTRVAPGADGVDR